ncbi:MAG TPA: DUF305 domain-containing protein [Egicoccus sp.]|nr:DUF305 domain-containing protein [Egicoccus sp.]HSK21984.1 DUF305 domain-containing protein [Egicoccus sp.]
MNRAHRIRLAAGVTVAMVIAPTVAAHAAPVYVRPGAPGQPTQRIAVSDVAVPVSGTYTMAEVHFVQHMMVHHGQALTMTALVADRAGDERIHNLARRIDVTQVAEIDQMAQWLRIRSEAVPDHEDSTGHEGMPGMVSQADLARLEASEGAAFDRLFLELMIHHHRGAVQMVEELREATGDILEAGISALAFEIEDQQQTEIVRMQRLLDELSA